jgi:periplasmic protein TonB
MRAMTRRSPRAQDMRRAIWVAAVLCAAAFLGCARSSKTPPVLDPSPVPLENIRAVDSGPIDVMPRLVTFTTPEYPQQAIFDRITGTIRLLAEVDEGGRVTQVRVLQSLPVFDIPCIEAMQGWRFTPALRAGQAVAFTVEVPFTFHIQ